MMTIVTPTMNKDDTIKIFDSTRITFNKIININFSLIYANVDMNNDYWFFMD